MRIVFMGSPDFSVTALEALHRAGHEIVAVYSQPPRPKGRGQGVEKTAVHQAAEAMGFDVRTPPSLKPAEEVAAFAALDADIAVVAAYGLILRNSILTAPRLGCVNIHASLLPRWRGAAPIQRAIEAGDAATGVTIMQMDVGLDTGPMLLEEATPITADDTSATIHERLAEIGGRQIVLAMERLAADNLPPQPQPEMGVTYAHKIAKEESVVDWHQPAAAIERKLRAFTPWPGLWTTLNGERLRLHQVVAHQESGTAGTIIGAPLQIACGEGSLAVLELQRAGRNRQSVAEFARGFTFAIGDKVA